VSDHFWLDPDYEAQVEAQSVRLKLSTLYPGYPMTLGSALIEAVAGIVLIGIVAITFYALFEPAILARISGVNVDATVVSCEFTPSIGKGRNSIQFTFTYKLPDGSITQPIYGTPAFFDIVGHTCEEFPIGSVLQISYQRDGRSAPYVSDSRLANPLWETVGQVIIFIFGFGFCVLYFANGVAKVIRFPVCVWQMLVMDVKGKLYSGEVVRCTRESLGDTNQRLEEWTLTYKFSTPQSTEIIGKQRARNSGLLKRSLPEPGISVTVVYANDHTYCVL